MKQKENNHGKQKSYKRKTGKERRVIGNRDIIGNRDRHDLMLETLPAMLKLENLPV